MYTKIRILGVVTIIPQARSQAKARKHGFQHHMGLDARNPVFCVSEQQRRRPACTSAQSDQHFCYSLSEKYGN